MRTITVRAPAKINLTLRVLGLRPDGYHELRTELQSLRLHDTLTCRETRGAFDFECDDPACPSDRTNLVWRAAELVWRAANRRGQPRNTAVDLVKRIPMQSGLGGGSSDAAAAIRGLSALWRINLPRERQHAVAAKLGADVPFFLEGGTALGVERGDVLFQLIDRRPMWVTLVIPPFGVSTKDAYGWWGGPPPLGDAPTAARSRVSGAGLHINDLQFVVAARHPEIDGIVRALIRHGAGHAAMSGSGSAVFGLFKSRSQADAAARALSRRRMQSLVTRTTSREEYRAMTLPTRRRS